MSMKKEFLLPAERYKSYKQPVGGPRWDVAARISTSTAPLDRGLVDRGRRFDKGAIQGAKGVSER